MIVSLAPAPRARSIASASARSECSEPSTATRTLRNTGLGSDRRKVEIDAHAVLAVAVRVLVDDSRVGPALAPCVRLVVDRMLEAEVGARLVGAEADRAPT